MAKQQGWIRLYRKTRDNPLWRKPLHPAMAWIDILMEVQHAKEPQKVMLGMRILTCNQGESLKSLQTWASRWGWSRSKTARFVRLLASERMVVVKSERITTRLTVVNYAHYSTERHMSGTETQAGEPMSRPCPETRTEIDTSNGLTAQDLQGSVKRKRNANETQVDTDKKVENDKNEKEEETAPPPGSNLHPFTITFCNHWATIRHVRWSVKQQAFLDPFFETAKRLRFAVWQVDEHKGRYHGMLDPWDLCDLLWEDWKLYWANEAEGRKKYKAWEGKAGELVAGVIKAVAARTDTADRSEA